MRRRPRETVYRITGAAPSITQDVDQRTKRYLWSMGIRTVCFVLAVVVTGWARWLFIALAIVLPYVSVVFANAGRETSIATPEASLGTVGDDERRGLEAPRS